MSTNDLALEREATSNSQPTKIEVTPQYMPQIPNSLLSPIIQITLQRGT